MSYKIKPKVKNPALAKIKKEKAQKLQDEKTLQLESEKKATKEKQTGQKRHKEVVDLVSENNTTIRDVLSDLKAEIAKIELQIPENDDAEVIVNSLESGNDKLIESVNKLAKQVSNIKLEPTKIDLDAHTKKMILATKNSSAGLEKVLKDLALQVASIKLEATQPITDWDFEFIRKDNGFTDRIRAKAIFDDRTLN